MTHKKPGLASLESVELDESSRRMLEVAAQCNQGPPHWRDRKTLEAQRTLALAQIAGPDRMQVLTLDMQSEMRAVVKLQVPVAMTPDADGNLQVADEAVIGIVYPQLILAVPLPGFSLATLLFPPQAAFYPNCGTTPSQRLCLGTQIPSGTPLSEIVLLCYGLLSMQSVMLDLDDRAGVMNPEAAVWWQHHTDRMPLTDDPFISTRKEGVRADG